MQQTWKLHQGDVLEVLKQYPDNHFDALFCDPPYGLKFMGKRWDYDVPGVDVWQECLRVLKPGAPLLAFGGSRTFHRMAVAIEDAGFEIRDTLMYIYGKGFPKSLNVSKALDKAAGAEREIVGTRALTGNAAVSLKDKGGTYGVQVGTVAAKEVPVTAPASEMAQQWDGWGTALKPAFEPLVLGRKPLDGTVVQNVTEWGCGALNIDGSRVGRDPEDFSGYAATGSKAASNLALGRQYDRPPVPDAAGRWPANLILGHTEDCVLVGTREGKGYAINRFTDGAKPFGNGAGHEYQSELFTEQVEVYSCVPECPVRLLDEQAGERKSGKSVTRNGGGRKIFGGLRPDAKSAAPVPDSGYTDSGGPSRFFYTAKVSTRERNAGCEHLALKSAGEATDREDDTAGLNSPRAGAGRTGGAFNHHPTLKPLSLTKYLSNLIRPPTEDARVLIPFAGAGSEMIGALQAGWPSVTGIEREAEYVEIARARIVHWCPHAEAARYRLDGEPV